ncbi:MAG: FAD-dependent oxidoreductase [Planctomycetia bacterium]|nr:FAD-dependent oxidoreductase [Planctomycetia bacterium]
MSGRTYKGKVFIDATFEGDLMAAAGVNHTISREGRKEYGESLAGKQYCAKKPAMRISGLDSSGTPLPLITDVESEDAAERKASDKEGVDAVIAYNFRLCLTETPTNRVPMPPPARYDAARFEAICRYYQAEPGGPLLWDLYPLPNGKFDANDGIFKQFSMSMIGGGNGWCATDAEGRKLIWEKQKQYTLEMYHFLTTDPAVPQVHRERLTRPGLCKDEFPDYVHLPHQLCVREGRRMRGQVVLTQADIMGTRTKPDPIAIGSFPLRTGRPMALLASVGRAERITRSNSRGWSGWMRPSLGGAEELPSHAQGRIFHVDADRPLSRASRGPSAP